MRKAQRGFTGANARAKRLRREPTTAEVRLWKMLRRIEGCHFRRQAAVGPHVFDFGELRQKLLIEVDGGIHDLQQVQDRDRTKELWARAQGFAVLRIPNDYVFGTGELAIAMVIEALREQSQRSER